MYIRGGFLSVAASPPSDVTAVQDGPTSIRVSWTESTDATGYGITYTGGGSSDGVAVGDTNTHTLMGLTNGETYTISIAGTSSSSGVLPSPPVSVGDVALGKSKTIQCSVHGTNHPMLLSFQACVSMCVCVSRFVCPCYDGSSTV